MENNIKEIWKTIGDYPDYMISSMGRVKSLKFGKEIILKNSKNSFGYLIVNLCKDGKHKIHKVHRLVAQAFIPNPENKPHIDHINTDRTDNRVENLRWVTRNENMNNPLTKINKSKAIKGDKHPMYGKIGKLNPKSKAVLQFDKNMNFIRKWISATEVERELNICANNIGNCCRNKYKFAYGYIWRYEKDIDKEKLVA